MIKNINNILIDESDINLLKRYNININNYQSIRQLQIDIERLINFENLSEEELDELDYLEERLQEIHYYRDTNK